MMVQPFAVVVGVLLIVRSSAAQSTGAYEARVDGIAASRVTTVHLGIGGTRVASRNLELQAVVGAGFSVRDGVDENTLSGRGDVLARFAPLPADRQRWSAYVAGGVSTIVERGARGRAVLALLVGVEGGRARASRGFFEVGVGGGLRAGMGVRF